MNKSILAGIPFPSKEYRRRFWIAYNHHWMADWIGLSDPEEEARIRAAHPWPEMEYEINEPE